MGVRSYVAAIAVVLIASCFTRTTAQSDDSEAIDAQINASQRGFRTSPELQEIQDLMSQHLLKEAHERATSLVARSAQSFASAKEETFIKGSALYTRSQIATQLRDEAGALNDLERAAEFGHASAAYWASRLLVDIGRRQDDEHEQAAYLKAVTAYLTMGAELAEPAAIRDIQTLFQISGQSDEEHYWFLVERMSENLDAILRFSHMYHESYTQDDRKYLDHVMRTQSLSGGEVISAVPGLPGRSTLASAFVDLGMRRQLEFVWRAFYSDEGSTDQPTLELQFHTYRKIIREANPLVDMWLLVNAAYAHNSSEPISLPTDQLTENALPGDQIMVRCGRLVHYAVVWAFDGASEEVLLLDPFDEFWQPSHNRCVTRFERQPYRYQRQLVRILKSELRSTLVAVLSIRDRAP